ncbi:hypothetical protein FHG87_009258 [Trinorchestia longiramus]|nr:hypothetical protein FHG87_009258 [Trinorchestia longiramus]
MNTNPLQQQASELTRQNNIVNLAITTLHLRIIGLEVTDKIGAHHLIDFVFQVYNLNVRTELKNMRDYMWTNFELMKEELGNFTYVVLMLNKNAEEYCMISHEEIATATEHHLLTKRIRPSNNTH